MERGVSSQSIHPIVRGKPTGTFFWDRTTAQSFPLTPTDMMFAAVMALKAYSVRIVSRYSMVPMLGYEASPSAFVDRWHRMWYMTHRLGTGDHCRQRW